MTEGDEVADEAGSALAPVSLNEPYYLLRLGCLTDDLSRHLREFDVHLGSSRPTDPDEGAAWDAKAGTLWAAWNYALDSAVSVRDDMQNDQRLSFVGHAVGPTR